MSSFSLLTPAGVALWLGVGVLLPHEVAPVACWLVWGATFVLATTERFPLSLRQGALAAQVVAGVGCALTGPSVATALLAATAGQLPFFVGTWPAAAVAAAQLATVVVGEGLRDGWDDAALAAALYGAFQAFSLGAATLAVRERAAREVVLALNAELIAARAELATAERRDERLRIARDLHDAVGHHLTALGLQLELAARQTDGPAREAVLASREVARELLAEVRATVGALRDGPIELAAGLRALTALPRPVVEVTGHPEARGPAGEVLLRAAQEIVTNAARHGRAGRVWLSLHEDDGQIVLSARDDGPGVAAPAIGNGLRGMRERVEALGGTLEVAGGPGFPVTLRVPA
ncbi:MAG: sensor histidine kinase [Alphaproteobacteria bacterium]|nr:sensor histidine kinase [Alphaproteobacteria bacterium]MCB9696006.1 sensor histidine kinase [Alphaproteobacteria bacterium]